MSHIKFTTDSAADIPAALRESLNIQVMPFPIAVGEREYADGFDFTPQEFYEILLQETRIPTHAQLTPYDFTQCFEAAWKEGCTDLIHTSINSKASSTFQNALQAREEFYEDHPEARESFRIHLIDSLTYTMGYGWAVIRGAQMAREGVDAERIVEMIRDWLAHVRVVFAPLDLRFAKKSGRVSAAAAFMGEALGLKPVMTFVDGESAILSKVRGEKNVISALLDLCKKERQPGSPYMVICGSNTEQARKLQDACHQELDIIPAMEYCIGGVIAINAGPNMIGLVYRSR